jgi:hypothetical protein
MDSFLVDPQHNTASSREVCAIDGESWLPGLGIRICYSCYFFRALSMSIGETGGIAETDATAETWQ